MLQETNRLRVRLPGHTDLARVELELNLTSTQLPSWGALVETYDEVRDAIEAIETITAFRCEEHAPTLAQVLDMEAKYLAVRLGSVRRLHGAVAKLGRVLTPRQRIHADRLLAICFRDLGYAPHRSS